MITEDYVSFETAMLLKEKGFDGYCDLCFNFVEIPRRIMDVPSDGKVSYEDGILKEEIVLIPTLQMAVKWVQEAHNIIIIPNYEYECDSTPWCYKIFKLGENGKPERVAVKGVFYDKDNKPTEHIVGYRDYERSHKDYSTKEEAIEEGIKYCLENLI